jgi:Ca2+-dependent lipid-binding protein
MSAMSWMVVVLLVLMVVIIACQWHYISVSRKTQREIKDELQRYSSDEQKRNLIEHRAALVSRILAAGVTKDPERS